MTLAPSSALSFKVADLGLAEAGRHQLRLAENEMPGLMALRAEFGESKPLAGTALALDFSAAKALPFRTDEPVRPKISVRQRAVVPTRAFPVMSPVIPPVTRTPPGANPLVVPDLSLADYAALRAHLIVRGEEDPET